MDDIEARNRLGWALAIAMLCIGLGLPVLSSGLILEPSGCSASRRDEGSGELDARRARQLRERRMVKEDRRAAVESRRR